jgi:hypothetical protein
VPADLEDLQAKLSALMGDMHGAFSVQINALQSALAKLQTAVKGVSSGTSSIAEVRTAVDGVTTATANLGTAFAQAGCIGGGERLAVLCGSDQYGMNRRAAAACDRHAHSSGMARLQTVRCGRGRIGRDRLQRRPAQHQLPKPKRAGLHHLDYEHVKLRPHRIRHSAPRAWDLLTA